VSTAWLEDCGKNHHKIDFCSYRNPPPLPFNFSFACRVWGGGYKTFLLKGIRLEGLKGVWECFLGVPAGNAVLGDSIVPVILARLSLQLLSLQLLLEEGAPSFWTATV
jgi:hypothetical protein